MIVQTRKNLLIETEMPAGEVGLRKENLLKHP